ncbi:MAG: heavy-metal-associated domain-containing protein [Verrucomicrobiales bacterium]|nr:heavy-metal-associated domain-containing protein [Verrucomicrobiales bacterium]
MKTLFATLLAVGIALLGSHAKADDAAGVIRISVPDMVCEGCAFSVTKALKKLEGVTDAHVDPKTKVALVNPKPSAKISDEAIKKAVDDAGYEAKEIERVETTFAKAKADLEKSSS